MRRSAYTISAAGVAWYLLLPQPNLALTGALLMQTLAYILIAGRSAADGIVVAGVSLLIIGFLPDNHPLLRGPFFETVRIWILAAGAILLLGGLVIIALNPRRRV